MSKKLTPQQVTARINMYQEAADHLLMSIHDNKTEEEQAKVVHREIIQLRDRFENRY